MTRPIKFRAWNKEDKRWIPAEKLNLYSQNFIIELEAMSPGVDIMQFTGLLDKNGKEIYEGDVVKVHVEKPFITQIVWELCGLRLKDTLLGNMNEEWGKDLEIIGNIYENPELIKN